MVRKISQLIEPQNAIGGASVWHEYGLDRVRNLEREIVRVDEEIDKRYMSITG